MQTIVFIASGYQRQFSLRVAVDVVAFFAHVGVLLGFFEVGRDQLREADSGLPAQLAPRLGGVPQQRVHLGRVQAMDRTMRQ